ncbi:MAG: AMP-binding protein [Bacteroidia bacterium]|nr:AMP-binding protein [Bacteroidia bacterium]
MLFDFKSNKFIQTEGLTDRELIVGSDEMFSEKKVYEIHLTLKAKIQDLGIPSGHPVCIYGEKEALFPIVMITLMSLDIPYIPIDVIMPAGRIEKIKEQTSSQVLINCSEKNCDVDFEIVINKKLDIKIKDQKELKRIIPQDDILRYILFTSGSTGVPKGVQITAKALNSFAEWYLSWPGINKDAVLMNQAPFSFDVSLCDFIAAFGAGSKIVLNNYSILKSGNLFLERLKQQKANTLICTPSFIQMYLSVPEFNSTNFPELRQVVFMGEELHTINVKKLKAAFPSLKVVNAYGPTEATVVVTYVELTDKVLSDYAKSLPIGYCRPGGEMLVLDADDESGVGELGIVGQNLSIGYLNDEEKTNKAFIQYQGKRVYKTGDVGYIKNDLIFYMGRNDSQVKLNGYRIELDEIGNVLLSHPAIKNAVVVPLTNKNVTKKIISFIVLKENNSKDISEDLKAYLLQHLPSYMIPSEFIVKDNFPMNSNYKTDKKALLEEYLNG